MLTSCTATLLEVVELGLKDEPTILLKESGPGWATFPCDQAPYF